jgi:hypothetical protein
MTEKAKDISEILRPASQQDDFTETMMGEDYGFVAAKRLEDGTYVGLQRLFSTIAICIDVQPFQSFSRRYCYRDLGECLKAFSILETGSDVPEGWVARRPETPEDIAEKNRPPRPQRDDSLSM